MRFAEPYRWGQSEELPDKLINVNGLYLQIALDTGGPLPLGNWERTNYAMVEVYIADSPYPSYKYPPPPRTGAWVPGTDVDFDGYVRIFSPNGLYQISGCGSNGGLDPPRKELHCRYRVSIRNAPPFRRKTRFAPVRLPGLLWLPPCVLPSSATAAGR